MQDDAAEHLDVEVAHPEDSFSGFAHDSEGFRKEIAEEIVHLSVGAGFLELAAKLEGFPTQFVVGESKDVFFDRVDVLDDRLEFLDFTGVGIAKEFLKHGDE